MGALRLRWTLVAAALLACATPIQVREEPAASDLRPRKLALIPVSFSFEPLPDDASGPSGEEAAELVTARLLEALVEGGVFQVVPPTESVAVLARAGALDAPSDPVRVGALLEGSFGVDGYLSGNVRRFRARLGGQEGARRPASVGFDLELRDARTGMILWSGSYDETQASLTSGLEYLGLAWQRSFRWLSADELAAYGSRTLVASLNQAGSRWR